jgi:hypothetical protein
VVHPRINLRGMSMTHPPVVSVLYNSPGWHQVIGGAINSKNFLRIRIKGSMASQVRIKLEAFTVVKVPAPPAPFVPVPYPNIAVSAFLVSLPALLNYVLLALTAKGYKAIAAGFDPRSAGTSDDELILMLT